jgi:hypothetical protein
MDMKIKKQDEEKPAEKLVVGAVRCLDHTLVMAAWNLIKPEVEKIVAMSLEEYQVVDVWKSIFSGQSILYLGYLDREGKIPKHEYDAYVAMKLLGESHKDYVGYMLMRVEQSGIFIWQLYIAPEFQKSNCMQVGLEFIAAEAKNMGSQYLSFSSTREAWGRLAPTMGFQPTFTVYRKSLKE